MSRLDKILNPQSVAIIGASRKEGSLGKMLLDSVLKMQYKGEIFPVNPKTDEISGIKCFPDIKNIPRKPDLAIILLPGLMVKDSLEEIGGAGIRHVIVVSAGFREVGGEGIDREIELMATAKKYKMNLVGPNCMGIFNTASTVSFNGTFSPTMP